MQVDNQNRLNIRRTSRFRPCLYARLMLEQCPSPTGILKSSGHYKGICSPYQQSLS